jgi:hypothetical protein
MLLIFVIIAIVAICSPILCLFTYKGDEMKAKRYSVRLICAVRLSVDENGNIVSPELVVGSDAENPVLCIDNDTWLNDGALCKRLTDRAVEYFDKWYSDSEL